MILVGGWKILTFLPSPNHFSSEPLVGFPVVCLPFLLPSFHNASACFWVPWWCRHPPVSSVKIYPIIMELWSVQCHQRPLCSWCSSAICGHLFLWTILMHWHFSRTLTKNRTHFGWEINKLKFSASYMTCHTKRHLIVQPFLNAWPLNALYARKCCCHGTHHGLSHPFSQ